MFVTLHEIELNGASTASFCMTVNKPLGKQWLYHTVVIIGSGLAILGKVHNYMKLHNAQR